MGLSAARSPRKRESSHPKPRPGRAWPSPRAAAVHVCAKSRELASGWLDKMPKVPPGISDSGHKHHRPLRSRTLRSKFKRLRWAQMAGWRRLHCGTAPPPDDRKGPFVRRLVQSRRMRHCVEEGTLGIGYHLMRQGRRAGIAIPPIILHAQITHDCMPQIRQNRIGRRWSLISQPCRPPTDIGF